MSIVTYEQNNIEKVSRFKETVGKGTQISPKLGVSVFNP
jgi:hypothetical protein